VHLPELSLVVRSQCRLGGDAGEITILVGIEFDDEPNLLSVLLDYPFDGRTGRDAVRSLIIDKLDDCDGRVIQS